MLHEFRIRQELTESARAFVEETIRRSFRLHRLVFEGDRVLVDVDDEISSDRLDEVITNVLYVARSISRKVVFENPVAHAYRENPMAALEASRDVIRTADGMFSFQGTFWKVFKALQTYVAGVAESYAAIEQEYPALWPVDLYKKINYFREFPQQVILSAPLENDYEVRSRFAESYDKHRAYHAVSMGEGFADATYGLQCAVCDTCYYNLRHTREHPNTVYTTYNKVFRNERSATGGLDRLLTFSVRDIMFVGDKDFVLLYRQRMLDEAARLLERLNLDSKLETANDPFFSNDAVVKNVFQSASELKYELLARVYHSDSYMAVGSVNFHLDFFGQAFDIQGSGGLPVYSGCWGVGFERLTYALYCQYGPDATAWPADVRNFLGL
jgi:hypothetical protein